MIQSILCRREHFDTPWFSTWVARLGYELPATLHLHRKVWEYAAIAQAFEERGVLQRGKQGLGFAVGQEPLVSLFAAYGTQIDATDLGETDSHEAWTTTGQHAANREVLYKPDLISREAFEEHVSFYPADMNNLDKFESESVDFLWSSCAMEHLGTLENGMAFVERSMDILKVGGVACHTTEINISHSSSTLESGINVIYRESDLRELDCRLRLKSCCLETLDLDKGHHRDDLLFDIPPYGQPGRFHIKLMIDGFISTSQLLICRKYA